MLKWKLILIAAGASLAMYGCSAKTPAPPPGRTDSAHVPAPEDAQNLFKLRTPLIGDAPADGKLADAVKNQFGITESSTLELMTEKEPYELILHFTEEPDPEAMKKSASLLLGLIDNCGIVSWTYPIDSNGVSTTLSMDVRAASKLAGVDDIKAYSQTEGKVWELLELLSAEPAEAAAEPAVKAGEPKYNTGFG